jgi:hypothetical protein
LFPNSIKRIGLLRKAAALFNMQRNETMCGLLGLERNIRIMDLKTFSALLFFLKKISGVATLPSNIYDENNITEIRFVPLIELQNLNFSSVFINLVFNNFPDAGNYMGHKSKTGL